MENLVKIKNLKKNYYTKEGEITAIEDFTFTVEKGKFIALVGPSGCGKSTLLSILCGLEEKTNGELLMNDSIKFGYMPQTDALFPWRNVLDNCSIGLEINKTKNKKNTNRIIEFLKKYGLGDFIYKYPNELSGGMRQRVALIRTLTINPDILILDEPFSALDYQSRLSLSNDIYKIIKEEDKTVIMVTHDIAEAISMADTIIIMSNRPSHIKKIIDIDFSGEYTPIEKRKHPYFVKYYDTIWKEIDHYDV